MKFNNQANSAIIKAVFNSALVESSSDLIDVLYETFLRIHPENIENLHPIHEFESANWRIGAANITHTMRQLDKMEYADLVDAKDAYLFIIELIIENETLTNIYKLDDEDVIGKQLMKELGEKLEYCQRLMGLAMIKA